MDSRHPSMAALGAVMGRKALQNGDKAVNAKGVRQDLAAILARVCEEQLPLKLRPGRVVLVEHAAHAREQRVERAACASASSNCKLESCSGNSAAERTDAVRPHQLRGGVLKKLVVLHSLLTEVPQHRPQGAPIAHRNVALAEVVPEGVHEPPHVDARAGEGPAEVRQRDRVHRAQPVHDQLRGVLEEWPRRKHLGLLVLAEVILRPAAFPGSALFDAAEKPKRQELEVVPRQHPRGEGLVLGDRPARELLVAQTQLLLAAVDEGLLEL
eukprot:CAMPEP_0198596996 /NCGR_PEP_ID=MMETSP1462-20131121/143894_1 /TAXON_ID=1333877 /ORGANISM="Brandtodinium nutriculum, Strain RCC3387" /LENGTH=268 /DNA_ID=CAMNT_0044328647 /DNA_START=147 /DNA_END=949 /DNA_ORIENTATION=-